MQQIHEGKAIIWGELPKIVSMEMDVFYNPVMKLNRDISVLLLNAIDIERMRIADILAGSGIRAIRFFLEVDKNKIQEIVANDYSLKAAEMIKKNFGLNKIKSSKIRIENRDANDLLRESSGFEYIDIDPFGYPGRFLESSVLRLSRGGILAVTATDLSALCGSSHAACRRKYWAIPLRNEFMHETGLRILIRRVQLIGAVYEKALTPVLSYYKDHYMRVFFLCEKGKTRVDKILRQHGFVSYCRKCLWRSGGYHALCGNCRQKTEQAGQLWTGKFADRKLAARMLKGAEGESRELLTKIRNELAINEPYFYDVHKMVQKYKKGAVPKHDDILKAIKKAGYKATYTHFRKEGIRSTIPVKKFAAILRTFP